METYKVICDEPAVKSFIDWLPKLLPSECYYVSLFARHKYCPDVKLDKAQLKRFTATSKDMILPKLHQLESPIGSYIQDGKPIAQEGLACYILPNPRSMEKAAKNGLIRLAELITKPYNGYNPHTELMSCIHKSPSKKRFFDIDFDGAKPEEAVRKIDSEDLINLDCLSVIETRGGFHLIVHLEKIDKKYQKVWHNSLTNLAGADVTGDNMIPIPGTYQGGFIPKLTGV